MPAISGSQWDAQVTDLMMQSRGQGTPLVLELMDELIDMRNQSMWFHLLAIEVVGIAVAAISIVFLWRYVPELVGSPGTFQVVEPGDAIVHLGGQVLKIETWQGTFVVVEPGDVIVRGGYQALEIETSQGTFLVAEPEHGVMHEWLNTMRIENVSGTFLLAEPMDAEDL
jgi:hypothetical protein